MTYCSNLHPIEELHQVLEIAKTFWPRISASLNAEFPGNSAKIDLGVWLSRKASFELLENKTKVEELKDQLRVFDGQVLTANAFPMGDFHQGRVKEDVYRPDWQDSARLQYSKDVACLLAQLPSQSTYQSMSTSPGSFKKFKHVDEGLIASNLASLAIYLNQLEQETGRHIMLAIEPEPGCTIEHTRELIHFYESRLLLAHPTLADAIRRHIGMCFDCCHQSIQYEDPREVLGLLRSAGIKIAKVQLSSALELKSPAQNDDGLDVLSSFAEDRYLHQVVARTADGQTEYFDDLPDYLRVAKQRSDDSARIHFHVPIFLDQLGSLSTTQADLTTSLSEIIRHDDCQHLEIETYSWGVMPERRHQQPDADKLLEDVLAEYRWVSGILANISS